jgi:P-type Ca2+ transporter type 2C
VAAFIVKMGGVTAVLLFVALFIRFAAQLPGSTLDASEKGQQFVQILIISVVILVIAVPEGLPLAVTLALAYATIRMLKDHNLVRVLKSCETMGNATTVCSDKTGTLTENRMTVVVGMLGVADRFEQRGERIKQDNEIDIGGEEAGTSMPSAQKFFSNVSRELTRLLCQSIAANSTAFEHTDASGRKEFIGSKTETALLELAQRYLGMDNLSTERHNAHVFQLYPFNSERKCMGTVIKQQTDGHASYRLYVKGAAEILLAKCARIISGPNLVPIVPLSEDNSTTIKGVIDEYASQSLRTIALVYRDFSDWPPSEFTKSTVDDRLGETEIGNLFRNMTWLGVMGIMDPIRPGVIKAVQDCRTAGVFVRMVTGDNVHTAKAIATECGIFTADGIIMEGPRFRALDEQQMDQTIPRLQVLARSSPEDKRILVARLKKLGEVVAVTGDGTNDGPALRMADVGFSMGISGTEVAKEAASIILMDDDFTSIVKAIMWGRCVNDAVKKFLQVSHCSHSSLPSSFN